MGYETYESVEHLGLDETSIKGHHYLTLFVDTENRKSIFCIKGKNTRTIKKFVKHFQDHKGKLKNIKTTTCDMS
jgi:transposase